MTRQEFEAEMGKTKGMFIADVEHNRFWWGYADGLRQGFYGMNFRGEETHIIWWAAAEDADPSRSERGWATGLAIGALNSGRHTALRKTSDVKLALW